MSSLARKYITIVGQCASPSPALLQHHCLGQLRQRTALSLPFASIHVMSSYYSSSLLSTYLEPDRVPQIQVQPVDEAPQPDNTPRPDNGVNITVPTKRNSTCSTASTKNSLYSSEGLVDLDLQSVRLNLEKYKPEPHESKLKKFGKRLLGKDPAPEVQGDDDDFFAHVQARCKTYYHYEKTTTLRVPWQDAAEVLLFGGPLDELFEPAHLLNYLVNSSRELGEVRWSNLSRYHDDMRLDVPELLYSLQGKLASFNEVLDLYAELDSNVRRPELFERFSGFANDSDGLCIPLAVAMFGNWLLTYNRDATLESNFENTLIVDYFRKAARLALALLKAQPLLEQSAAGVAKPQMLQLQRYWGKDCRNALSTSLHGLGEYYQFVKEHDVAVTLWELNCHLTGDAELGQLAIMGLTDGYGFGNRTKEHNRLGKKLKTNKFNTKRRIAHLYRILLKDPNFSEYGVSWATKPKYD